MTDNKDKEKSMTDGTTAMHQHRWMTLQSGQEMCEGCHQMRENVNQPPTKKDFSGFTSGVTSGIHRERNRVGRILGIDPKLWFYEDEIPNIEDYRRRLMLYISHIVPNYWVEKGQRLVTIFNTIRREEDNQ